MSRDLDILEALADRASRPHVLETCLCAFALVAPDAIPRPLTVSPACACVLSAIYGCDAADMAAARVALVACVSLAVARDAPDLQREAVSLAEDAATLTAQELASVGGLTAVLALLASEHAAPRARARRAA